jgi:HPr kinase/phosphorylase
MRKLTVNDLIVDQREIFAFSVKSGNEGLARDIIAPYVNRLGLSLCGHFSHFPAERVQIYGPMEHSYLETLTPENRENILSRIFSSFKQIPCVITTNDIEPFQELVGLSRDYTLPLLQTHMRTTRTESELNAYLEKQLSPSTSLHGTLVELYGVGVLILGIPGIGKSECALELLKQGHMFVADDVIEITLRPGGVLIGKGNELIKYHMEVRGLGIIDVRALFGIGAILDTAKIELVVQFEKCESISDVDRTGLDEEKINILGIDVPKITAPVLPGRNLCAFVEVSALNQRLKQRGYYSAKQLDKKLIDLMAQKKSQ